MRRSRANPTPTVKRFLTKAAAIKEVIGLERLVWEVAQDRDAESFRKLVPADAIMIFQSGIMTQPLYLKTMKKRTISRYKLGKIRGSMPNDSTVILLYEASRVGKEGKRKFPEGRVIESTIWVKRNNRWVAVLNQETPLSR
jgi:hypothetical protein